MIKPLTTKPEAKPEVEPLVEQQLSLSLATVAEQLIATIVGDELQLQSLYFKRISIDSRSIQSKELYIAISGEKYDGHDFILEAIAKGAIACVVEQVSVQAQEQGIIQLQVKDCKLALAKIASLWTKQWRQKNNSVNKIIAITGSCGKTTVKEMISSIAIQKFNRKESVLSTKGNLNNEFGVPLTLMRLKANHQLAVIEMGANHLKEIAYLNEIAKPDIAIVTNAGNAHIEGFGSLDGVAKGKGELFSIMSDDAVAIINNDDCYADYWKNLVNQTNNKVITFATESQADVRASNVVKESIESIENTDGQFYQWQVTSASANFVIKLAVPGKHNLANALAAIATGQEFGATTEQIQYGLALFNNVAGRLEINKKQQSFTLINDTYNANPESVKAAIDVLACSEKKRKILVLGDMAELGEDELRLHQQIGEYCAKQKINELYTLGSLAKQTLKGFNPSKHQREAKSFDTLKDLSTHLRTVTLKQKNNVNDTIILIKGSRKMTMEKVVEALEELN